MASFLKNTFDNLVNNINSTLNYQSSHRPPPTASQATSHANSSSRAHHHNHHHNYPHNQRSSTDRPSNNPNSRIRRDPWQYYNNIRVDEQSSRANHHQQNPSSGRRYCTQQPQQQNRSNMDNTTPNLSPTTNANTASVEKLDIGDVRDPNEINKLSAKELKIILTRNCVDYKGIFEKEVLREKVMQLWIDCNEKKGRRKAARNQSDKTYGSQDDSDIDENQACKICMEREINCVLLECGHMLTCVTCGRKLAECPICRQNVTRCVRTFKG